MCTTLLLNCSVQVIIQYKYVHLVTVVVLSVICIFCFCRQLGVSIDNLKLESSFDGSLSIKGGCLPVQVSMLCLELMMS